MKEFITPFASTVGYMLKVLKSNVEITEYNEEFKMIRHGNYFEFINSVKGEVPESVVYQRGVITSGNTPREDDFDFLGLFNSNPSLVKFYNLCYQKYGPIRDSDVPNEIYGIVALFEISLRMHANNKNLLNPRSKLVDVIDVLSEFKELEEEEIFKLHQGRRFTNMVKHFNNQFPTWEEGINAMKIAYQLLKNHKLTIV